MQTPQSNIQTLQEAMDFIANHFVFSEAHYPVLAKLNEAERLQFSINHSLQHMAKQVGKIATHLESVDHGGEGNAELLREAVVKEFINILRVAELIGMNSDDLLRAIPTYMR